MIIRPLLFASLQPLPLPPSLKSLDHLFAATSEVRSKLRMMMYELSLSLSTVY